MRKRRSSKQAAPGVMFTDIPRDRLSGSSRPIGRDPTAPTLPIKPFERSRLGQDIEASLSEVESDFHREQPNTSRALGAIAALASGRVRFTRNKGAKK